MDTTHKQITNLQEIFQFDMHKLCCKQNWRKNTKCCNAGAYACVYHRYSCPFFVQYIIFWNQIQAVSFRISTNRNICCTKNWNQILVSTKKSRNSGIRITNSDIMSQRWNKIPAIMNWQIKNWINNLRMYGSPQPKVRWGQIKLLCATLTTWAKISFIKARGIREK